VGASQPAIGAVVNTSKGSSQPVTDASSALVKPRSPRRDGGRKPVGHRRGELPRGPKTRRAAVVGSWLNPRLAVANLRGEQSLEGGVLWPKVIGETRWSLGTGR